MRCLIISMLLLAGFTTAKAGTIVELTFSGTFSNAFGNINAGDAFSGTAIWDTATVGANPAFPTDALLLNFSLTLPAGDGLSVTSLPDSRVKFAAANYTTATSGIFANLQINETLDGTNFYTFEFGAKSPSCSPHCRAL